MLASAPTTSFTGARVVSKTTARRAKRAVAARAGQYDDELLETAVRDRRRERTRGADGGRMRCLDSRAHRIARDECARTAIDRWGTIVKMGG